MRPFAAGAALAAASVLLAGVVHSAFACTMRSHAEPPCHEQSGHDGGGDRDEAPTCCQQPATFAAVREAIPSDGGARTAASVAAPCFDALASSVLEPHGPRLLHDVGEPPLRVPRTHLFLQTLLL